MERRRSLLGVNNSMYNYEICQYTRLLNFDGNTTITSVKFGDMPNLISGRYMFASCTNLTSVEIGNLPVSTDNRGMFMYSSATNIKIGNVNASQELFYICRNVVSVEIGNISAYIADAMFYQCFALKDLTIGGFPNVTNTTNMFSQCTNLENITINGSTCAVSFGLPHSSKLTHTSLMNIINALPTVETQQTLTLHATAKARLSEEDIAIATNKNWIIA